ncbi:MAG TPA: hypothetical protein VFZ65_03420 [Planctomycetota bacterium]|nr:hypothetical protein [Planctomycetota bacterium]
MPTHPPCEPRARGGVLLTLALVARLAAQDPVIYTIGDLDRTAHTAVVVATFATDGQQQLDVFLPVWSPGFYRVENHAEQVTDFAAADAEGKALAVERPAPNRWRVAAGGAARVVATYTLKCTRASVTTNQISDDFAVFCGPATFVAVAGAAPRPCEVRLELPALWPHAATGLQASEDGAPHHFRAPDYDWLCDSPIVAGTLRTETFDVAGARHELVCFGDVGDWDAALAARKLQPIAAELCHMFGAVPFDRYVFLDGFRPANGGLEHLNSTLITSRARTPADDPGWLAFVAHEYCHTFNVKRLRPIELGPFDYEHPPSTPSLWISEGLTTYLANLACARCGVASPERWLQMMSDSIRGLQGSAGRKVQTLADASLSVWSGSMSGTGGDPRKTVSYYVKGPVVGLLLDARLRAASSGAHGLDDLMRGAYARWSGARGFRPEEFEALANELAGTDLAPFFDRTLRSTDELDYSEVLQWFGLRFRPAADDAPRAQRWVLEPSAQATAEQHAHLRALLTPTPAARAR